MPTARWSPPRSLADAGERSPLSAQLADVTAGSGADAQPTNSYLLARTTSR